MLELDRRDLEDALYERLTGRCAHRGIYRVSPRVLVCPGCGRRAVSGLWTRYHGYAGASVEKLLDLMRAAGYRGSVEQAWEGSGYEAWFTRTDELHRSVLPALGETVAEALARAALAALDRDGR